MAATIEFQVENAYHLSKIQGVEVDTYAGWKARGRQVKRGEKSKSFRVKAGSFRRTDPITGEDVYETKFKTAYGFTIDQTY